MINHQKNILAGTMVGIILNLFGYFLSKGLRYFMAELKTGLNLVGPVLILFLTGFIITFIILEAIRSFRIR